MATKWSTSSLSLLSITDTPYIADSSEFFCRLQMSFSATEAPGQSPKIVDTHLRHENVHPSLHHFLKCTTTLSWRDMFSLSCLMSAGQQFSASLVSYYRSYHRQFNCNMCRMRFITVFLKKKKKM